MGEHRIKVQPPYMDALLDGSKTFEVRRNDRGYQRGDVLHLVEWETPTSTTPYGHHTGRGVKFQVSYVYAGDPRFGGIEPGYVVLGLAPVSDGSAAP